MKTKLVNENFTSNYLDNLLVARGLDVENLDYFYNVPDDSALENPLLLDNMEKGGKIFTEAVDNNKNICKLIYEGLEQELIGIFNTKDIKKIF